MTELRTAIPEEVDAYLDALVQKGVFANKAELVRSALVSYVNNTRTFFNGFDAETMFAPDGRLYQVEYARESAKRGGTAVGLVCEDGVLLAAEAVGKSKLSASVKKIHFLSDRVALVATGLVGDADLVMDELRAATPTPKTTDDVIRTMRGTIHRFTLSRTQRPLGVAFLVASMPDRKPRLAYLDPSGATLDYLATAMGRGATAALEFLESRYKKMRLGDAERLIPSLFGDIPTELGQVSG
jgi:proteasome alpha subunit